MRVIIGFPEGPLLAVADGLHACHLSCCFPRRNIAALAYEVQAMRGWLSTSAHGNDANNSKCYTVCTPAMSNCAAAAPGSVEGMFNLIKKMKELIR